MMSLKIIDQGELVCYKLNKTGERGGKVSDTKLSGKHILLLLLYSPGENTEVNEPIKGRTRIIKMMFLFEKELHKDFIKDVNSKEIAYPVFFPWNYGPFSKEIYNDIEFFVNNEFIKSEILNEEMSLAEISEFENWKEDYSLENNDELFLEEQFSLTDRGRKFTEEKIYGFLTSNQKSILTNFKRKLNSASLSAILRYVYLKYPEFTEKSEIRDKFFR